MSAYGGKINFNHSTGNVTFPFSLDIEAGASSGVPQGDSFPLFRSEAEDLRDQLDDLLATPAEYPVQVEILSSTLVGGRTFTYNDPSGTLSPGDLVQVPLGVQKKVGMVRQLGRGAYRGPLKSVFGLFVVEAFDV